MIFPNEEVEQFLNTCRFRLSDWFESSRIVRDGEFASTQLAETTVPKSISFAEDTNYVKLINENSSVTCVVTTRELHQDFSDQFGLVLSDNPKLDFFLLHNHLAQNIFSKPIFARHIDNTAKIHPQAFVDENCYIAEGVIVAPGAKILRNSYLDRQVIIGPNVVIGSDGLEFKRQLNDRLVKVEHVGGVYLGPGVEIMANSVVGKDVYFGFTQIGAGTKVGPLCNIGHRSKIGDNCSIAGNSTVGGSAKIGNSVWIGPSVTISSGVTVGNNAFASLGSVVVKDIDPGQKVSGLFAVDHKIALREYASITCKKK